VTPSPHIIVPTGDSAPLTYGLSENRGFYSLDAQAGRPLILVLVGDLPFQETVALLDVLQKRSAAFSQFEVDIVFLVHAQVERTAYSQAESSPTSDTSGISVVRCEAEVFKRWGLVANRPVAVVLDRSGRVVGSTDGDDAEATVALLLAAVSALPREPPREVALPAPVLFVQSIFSESQCRELISHFENNPHIVGGMASVDANGATIHKVDETKKRRSDFVLQPTDRYYALVMERLIRVCLPEMKRAFHFDACHTDRILIARYDETGGYFRRHRDNAAPNVAFRQFALSVNLNADYEGGYLQFPESSPHRYRPNSGAGIIFSSSLLHEATAVTKGIRYVLLTFFHNAEAQTRWLASQRS
jgi:predicted 2-oxoglutarate/Fe(II)-dependent dioxygenase YbiX